MKPKILLGITGGIAAYKSAQIASKLTQCNYEVFSVMTEAAKEFITPLTFRTLTQNVVEHDMFSPPQRHNVKHISLADRADLIVVAPATANFLARIAQGKGNDLLSTVLLASNAPVILAPAMNENMYEKEAVQENINTLQKRGYKIISPESGYLACGVTGKGRMVEPKQLIEFIKKELTPEDLKGTKYLVTAGPTREPVDQVRYFSNYSSGRMGYAIAEQIIYRGGEVKLISGPTDLNPPNGCETIMVDSAEEMFNETDKIFSWSDVAILAAAVADFKPKNFVAGKAKKENKDNFELVLDSNKDIMKSLIAKKTSDQIIAGFAAESENLLKNAREKFERKNPDLIMANDISLSDCGFISEMNAGYIIKENEEMEISLRSKTELANIILDEIKSLSGRK